MENEPPKRNTTNRTRSITRLSANSEAARRKQLRARLTIRPWRAFRTSLESVPEALQSQSRKIVPLDELASQLGVEPKRLLPALEYGYLKLASTDPPQVYEPPPSAIEWMRLMFQPLVLRPFLSTEMVADIEELSPAAVRQFCLDYNIPIYSDPVFGELMSISAFYRFHEQMHHQREPDRFDRQALIVALLRAADPGMTKEGWKAPPFSKRLEQEIRRIAHLKDPARTDAALRLWEAYQDAKKVTDCIVASRGSAPAELKQMERVERILEVEDT